MQPPNMAEKLSYFRSFQECSFSWPSNPQNFLRAAAQVGILDIWWRCVLREDVNGRLEHGHRLFVSCECLIKICYYSLVDFAQNGRGGTRNCEINRIYLTNTKQFTELCSGLDFKGTKKSPPAGLWMRLERKQSTWATL